jgi:peptidoglycan/LPS O-acetylase OafA/YrhL
MPTEVYTMQKNSERKQFAGIQALRGIAACMVVATHATFLWSQDFGGNNNSSFWENGSSGVDIFFVISGFVMAISIKNLTWSKFIGRRLLRIAPLYWLITSLTLLKLLAIAIHPSLAINATHLHVPLDYILASFLFIPYRNSVGLIQPIVSAGWTLSFEMFFYCLFALALALKVHVVRFLTPTLIILALVGLLHTGKWPSVTELASPLLLEFLAGVLLAYAVGFGFRINAAVSSFLGIIGFSGVMTLHIPNFPGGRALAWGASAFLVVQAFVMLEDKLGTFIPRWILRIGDASYSLYLGHMLVGLAAVRIIIMTGIPSSSEALLAAILIVISVATSLPLHSYVEKPLTAWCSRAWSRDARLVDDRIAQARRVSRTV